MKQHLKLKKIATFLLALVTAASLAMAPVTAWADNDRRAELMQKKEAAQKALNEINQQIEANKENKEKAQELKQLYSEQEQNIRGQIQTLQEQIEFLEEEIAAQELAIIAKQAEVDAKQAEYDARWQGFGDRLAAMQRINETGAVALLSSADNLFELLTFSKTLESLSGEDQTICAELEAERVALETEKQALEQDKATLEASLTEVSKQNDELNNMQQQLQQSIQAQDATISEADAKAEALAAAMTEKQKELDAAAKELDAILNAAVKQYGTAALTCSLDFGPALPSYRYISSHFGAYRTVGVAGGHRGTDFAAPGGTSIWAVADGIVTTAESHWSYGNYVQIYHGKDENGNTYSTLYAHMQSWPSVSAGQTVTKGTTIGYVGTTGSSTGNHLHLEMKINGVLTDAEQWIPH